VDAERGELTDDVRRAHRSPKRQCLNDGGAGAHSGKADAARVAGDVMEHPAETLCGTIGAKLRHGLDQRRDRVALAGECRDKSLSRFLDYRMACVPISKHVVWQSSNAYGRASTVCASSAQAKGRPKLTT
jgi:hypothetical protein